MLTRKHIISIFYDIVRFSKRKDIGGLNSIVYAHDNVSFESPTGGKTYADYLKGEFWARDWQLRGENPNDLKIETGVLFLESKDSKRTRLEAKTVCNDFYITFADVLECKTCDVPTIRTRGELDNETLSTLNSIVSELLNYRLYTIDGVNKWATEGYIANYVALYPLSVIVDLNKELGDYISSESLDFQSWGQGTQYIGYSTKLIFCGCSDSILEKDFFEPTIEQIGHVNNCKEC
jgi:hypothetical protein